MNKNLLGSRIKELRKQKGMSQEFLAEESGLSLRTIQRVENGESQPTGDSTKRLSNALSVTPNELMDWQITEDSEALLRLNLSQLSFIIFPFLGILIPLIIWISKKDKVKNIDRVGKSILNFQLSWTLLLFVIVIGLFIVSKLELSNVSFSGLFMIIGVMYFMNFIIAISNSLRYHNGKSIKYPMLIRFLS
ncbi:MAG: helix-turn-helix domain-containing protein [Bacteroidia bacterium]